MKRSRKGFGSIVELKSGKWLVKIPVANPGGNGTRYVTRTCASKTEAIRRQKELLGERENRRLSAGPRQSLKQYSEWILLSRNDRVSDRTRDGYLRNLRTHVFPTLGNRVMSDITAQELERLFSDLRSHRSASTVNNVRTALSKVFTSAVRHGLLFQSPVANTMKARKGDFEKTQVQLPWSPEEAICALKAAKGTRMELFITLALATGMRRGEMLGLQWADIDFECETVSIERTIHHESIRQEDGSTSRRLVVAAPKTASSRRVNQLSAPVLEAFKSHRTEQEIERHLAGGKWVNSGYVFTDNQGGPMDESNFYKKYKKFLAENHLRYVRIHDIRHTFATILIEEDSGKLAAVSKALGHSTIGITMDIYAKTARVDTHATSRMSEILFPDQGEIQPIKVPAPASVGSLPPGRNRSG